jgi:hypothetical protein
MKLKGQARVWWHSVEEQLQRLRQPPIVEWDEMKLKLQEKYLPIDYEDSVFEELLSLRQNISRLKTTHINFMNLAFVAKYPKQIDRQSLVTRRVFEKKFVGSY